MQGALLGGLTVAVAHTLSVLTVVTVGVGAVISGVTFASKYVADKIFHAILPIRWHLTASLVGSIAAGTAVYGGAMALGIASGPAAVLVVAPLVVVSIMSIRWKRASSSRGMPSVF
jgi:hypothetical protein